MKRPWSLLSHINASNLFNRMPQGKSKNSKRIHKFGGHKIGWGRSHSQGFERWAKLINRPNLSDSFEYQIRRNLEEKS